MKVADMTGALLDYWVASALGEQACIRRVRLTLGNSDGSIDRVLVDENRCLRPMHSERDKPQDEWRGAFWLGYSSNWELGGPLIEKHEISVEYGHGGDQPWRAEIGFKYNLTDGWVMSGSTPLIAAMRAYVFSTFGDTVPDVVVP